MSDELRATGDVAATGLRDMTTSIEAVHRSIARRAFRATPSGPIGKVHDAISAGVYAGVRGALTIGAKGGGMLASATESQWTTPERERFGAAARSAMNGAFGDALQREGNALAIEMAIRVDGRDVPLEPEALAAAFPDASSRVVVFLHGLCESDAAWRPDSPAGYAQRLKADLGVTPITLRYNSGLRIVENGRDLARLLEALCATWPAGVEQIALVGHSMGGLVIRAACELSVRGNHRWPARVRDAIYLGAPHGGAPLEKGAAMLAAGLRQLPETRPFAAAIERRSAGIKDLARGVVGDGHLPLAERVRHHAVAATLGPTPDAVLSLVFGDLLVHHASATGIGGKDVPDLAFEADDVVHLASASHFALLGHPAVYTRLRGWIGRDMARLLPPAGGTSEPSL